MHGVQATAWPPKPPAPGRGTSGREDFVGSALGNWRVARRRRSTRWRAQQPHQTRERADNRKHERSTWTISELYSSSEVVGTAMLVLLGCGVVANVALTKNKGFGGGFLMVTSAGASRSSPV